MKPRTEAELQKAIITLAKLMAIDRSLPERRVKLLKLYHIPNGVKPQGAMKGTAEWLQDTKGNWRRVIKHDTGTGKSDAARLGALEKALGVRRGMPDLHLPVADYTTMMLYRAPDFGTLHERRMQSESHSLYLEVKLPGKPVPEYQRLIHEELREEGNRVEVVRDTIQAERIFREHLAL